MSTNVGPEKDSLKHPCVRCGHETNHVEISVASKSDPDPYFGYEEKYMLVRCLGCGSISFRYESAAVEDYQMSEDGTWELVADIHTFPLLLEGHREVEGIHFVPWSVRQIYQQTLEAIKRDHYVLAAIGLRSTVEAVCNDQQIDGKNLSTRIGRLSASGIVSKKDAVNLHAIRFMGNDAAHDIHAPKKEAIMLALEIIEHIIETSYTFPARAAGHLTLPVETLDQFKELIVERLSTVESKAAFSLRSLLSKDMKRFLDYESLEKQMEQLVDRGDFSELEKIELSESQSKGFRIYRRRTE